MPSHLYRLADPADPMVSLSPACWRKCFYSCVTRRPLRQATREEGRQNRWDSGPIHSLVEYIDEAVYPQTTIAMVCTPYSTRMRRRSAIYSRLAAWDVIVWNKINTSTSKTNGMAYTVQDAEQSQVSTQKPHGHRGPG